MERELGICLAMMMAAAALIPFFASAVGSPLFGGQTMPVRIGLGRVTLGRIEGNVANFGLAAAMILLGRFLLI